MVTEKGEPDEESDELQLQLHLHSHMVDILFWRPFWLSRCVCLKWLSGGKLSEQSFPHTSRANLLFSGVDVRRTRFLVRKRSTFILLPDPQPSNVRYPNIRIARLFALAGREDTRGYLRPTAMKTNNITRSLTMSWIQELGVADRRCRLQLISSTSSCSSTSTDMVPDVEAYNLPALLSFHKAGIGDISAHELAWTIISEAE
jgi:hypothetical protein